MLSVSSLGGEIVGIGWDGVGGGRTGAGLATLLSALEHWSVSFIILLLLQLWRLRIQMTVLVYLVREKERERESDIYIDR